MDDFSADNTAVTVAEPQSESDTLVDRWWADQFPGSVLGHYTLAWNYVFEAVADLKQRLRAVNPG